MRIMRINRPEVWAASPFEQLSNLRNEISRLFELPTGEPGQGEFFGGWAPSLDLRESKDHLIATLELPGTKKENIDVAVDNGVLSVSGERTREKRVEEEGCHRAERFYGRFHRTVVLPKPVNADGIKAAYKDGLQTVTMPKTEAARPKQIEVTLG